MSEGVIIPGSQVAESIVLAQISENPIPLIPSEQEEPRVGHLIELRSVVGGHGGGVEGSVHLRAAGPCYHYMGDG